MAIVLAFSMMSATALRAFAVELTAGTVATQNAGASSANDVVYDTVYGVFGSDYGEYALMMKTVTYEAQYKTNPNYEFRASITDVVKTDGTVTVHGNNAIASHQKYIPGSATDYRFNEYSAQKTGLLKVTQKSTNKVGLKTIDGDQVIPCSYDSLEMTPSNDVMGFAFNGAVVTTEFMDLSGNSLGSVSFEAAEKTDNSYIYSNFYGDYIRIRAVFADPQSSSSQEYSVLCKKDGSTYKQATDVARVLSGSSNWALIIKNDGDAYYCPSGQEEINLGPCELS